ncbi:hypothetical protein MLD38_020371 [Melastoma candidum]|uniref:Uncharacterized protein n=1 Tax=Melastoma candidum TaxID=119954 RepID=A0ACB9QDX9_9MYRT|nr:hypothetical protein MLD38_020371 [Melastoma candidum]
MQSESVALVESETRENLGVENADLSTAAFIDDHVQAQLPVKKPTRQWAAWTRQEEESFFSALRQVGKNFEKITCRVQSKNKDQVRHYYYRLVRRMNKLLGPELCLDAKNSKDTNAAMLRWWSLLEKYSCNVSKLHLKPRRYKIFVEALENQLLKYRKKNDRKKAQGGCCSPSPSTTSNHNRNSQNDTRPVRLVLVDSQNTQKVAPGKPSSKNTSNGGKTRSNTKADIASLKPPRQRQKSAVGSAAAYKKWEKAAIAGVSLVADAAEHLERSAVVKDIENEPLKEASVEVHSVQVISPTHLAMNDLQPCIKLKLQLFPLDSTIRKALEMDNHNPHLELTLNRRKKISSIVEHLNHKWGSSTVASGELVLFPYNTLSENILACQRWTQKSSVSAAEVYALVGSPEVFRLRYGWVSDSLSPSGTLQACMKHCCRPSDSAATVDRIPKQIEGLGNDNQVENNELMDPLSTSLNSQPNSVHPAVVARKRRDSSLLNDDIMESSENADNGFGCAVEASDEVVRQQHTEDEMQLSDRIPPSAREWADSLTDISIGGLLDASICNGISDNCIPGTTSESPQSIPQSSFMCDSFDAAIAAHISRYQSKFPYESTLSSHEPSIWEAEETCDAFSFQRGMPVRKDGTTPSSTSSNITDHQRLIDRVRSSDAESWGMQEYTDNLPRGEPLVDMDMLDNQQSLVNPDPETLGLTDMYWPDSLGPFDLDIPSSKYQSEHFILSDSLSGLNRLLANSLDTFPNCSLFSIDKKEPTSTVEA